MDREDQNYIMAKQQRQNKTKETRELEIRSTFSVFYDARYGILIFTALARSCDRMSSVGLSVRP